MLKTLTVENVALIRRAEINFIDGLNVLSGETGSGKSVLLEAIDFVLGARADKTLICRGADKCAVSCVFEVPDNSEIFSALEEIGVDTDGEVIVRRVMGADGRGSIRVNGEPVTAQMLKKITTLLVDVHGQSDHFILLKEQNQLALLDGICAERVDEKKREISTIIANLDEIDEKLKKLGGSDEDRARRIDYLKYCIDEIERVGFSLGEDEELAARKKKLVNAEKIAEAVSIADSALMGDGGAGDRIGESSRAISSLAAFGEEYEKLSDRLSAVLDEINDISATLSSSIDEDFDPKEIDDIESRLDELASLKRKYGKTYADIREKLASYKDELSLLSDSAADAESLKRQRAAILETLDGVYDELTEIRKSVAIDLSSKLKEKLKELAFTGADFYVDFEKIKGVVSGDGNDKITFMFNANVGEEAKPLSKIISGGELSRLMLAIKSVSGRALSSFTFIFDEIDAGISGNTAFIVAKNFAEISRTRQIIAVSHLPQIVAMADRSVFIEKEVEDGRTFTSVRTLTEEEKIGEVVRLIGGGKGDDVSYKHAENLIVSANDFKKTLK